MNAECKNWLYAQAHLGGTDSLKAHSGSEHTCPWSNPIRPITERIFKELFDHHSIRKKKKKKKLQGEAGLQFGPQGSLVRRKKWRGWPLVVLTASISYLKGKRRLAVRLIRESVGNVSGHYAKCTAAGIQRFLTFVSISRMWRLYFLQSTIIPSFFKMRDPFLSLLSNKPEVIIMDEWTARLGFTTGCDIAPKKTKQSWQPAGGNMQRSFEEPYIL